jgi:hypothetical protein
MPLVLYNNNTNQVFLDNTGNMPTVNAPYNNSVLTNNGVYCSLASGIPVIVNIPSVNLTSGTTSIPISANITIQFVSLAPIVISGTTITGFLATNIGTTANSMRTLLASILTGLTNIPSFSSANILSYDATTFIVTIAIVPNSYMQYITNYQFNVNNYYALGLKGISTNFSFTTKSISMSVNTASYLDLATNIQVPFNAAYSDKYNLLAIGDRGNNGKVTIVNTTNYSLLTEIVNPFSTLPSDCVFFDDDSSLLYVQRSYDSYVLVYSITNTLGVISFTLLAQNIINGYAGISGALTGTINQFSVICGVTDNTGNKYFYISYSYNPSYVYKYSVNNSGVFTYLLTYTLNEISNLNGSLSFDSLNQQIIVGSNYYRIALSDNTGSYTVTNTNIGGGLIRGSFNSNNQLLFNIIAYEGSPVAIISVSICALNSSNINQLGLINGSTSLDLSTAVSGMPSGCCAIYDGTYLYVCFTDNFSVGKLRRYTLTFN